MTQYARHTIRESDPRMVLPVFVALWLTVFCAPVFAGDIDSIRLKNHVVVDSAEVHLRDVARLDGKRAEQLADVVILTLNANSKSANIGIDALHRTLAGHDVNWAFVTLGGFESCEVVLATADDNAPGGSKPPQLSATTPRVDQPLDSIPINPDVAANIAQPIAVQPAVLTLRDRVVRALAEFAAVPANELRVTFDGDDAELLTTVAEEGRFEVMPLSRLPLGRVVIGIGEFDGNHLTQRRNITVQVVRQATVFVAVRPIERGAKLTAQDIEPREVIITDSATEPVVKVDDALGRVADRAFRMGEPIDMAKLNQPLMVERNDVIEVRSLVGRIVVSTKARAREDGALGQMILVRNIRTREEFLALVTGPRQVQVVSVQPVASNPKAN